MPKAVEITVKNKLVKDKRGINVYHHSSRSAHLISHNSSIALPLGTAGEKDYLHISVVSGPGNLWKDCVIDVPSWINFELSSEGKMSLTHNGDRTQLRIPPGPPTWQLKMTRLTGVPVGLGGLIGRCGRAAKAADTVTVSDNDSDYRENH